MKELSTEEKAKAYDEAIEKARIWKNKSGMPKDRQGILDDIFPEIKESGDERIELLNYIYDVHDDDEERARWIAWLEKQGEQKPNYCHHEVDLSNCSEEYTKGYYDGWNNCNQQHAQLEAEQKPAWSEEDEMFVHGLIRGLAAKRDIHGHTTFSSDCIDITETINWLKSIKDRVQPQPKQEWSEEDKIIIRVLNELVDATPYKDFHNTTKYDCINFLRRIEKRVFPQPQQELNEEDLRKIEHALIDTYAMDSASKILNKIKSLRPQNMWKPSEEQIISLTRASNSLVAVEDTIILRNLLSDLLKLKE